MASFIKPLLRVVDAIVGRRRARYVIPDNYIGWVKVNYNVRSAESLPKAADGYLVHIFPPTGHLETSATLIQIGAGTDQYFYGRSDGTLVRPLEHRQIGERCEIWSRAHGTIENYDGDVLEAYVFFFVGLEVDYNRYNEEAFERARRGQGERFPKLGPMDPSDPI